MWRYPYQMVSTNSLALSILAFFTFAPLSLHNAKQKKNHVAL